MIPPTSSRVAVLGAGTMGRGIAQVLAACGYPVALHDVSEATAKAAFASLRATADRLVTRGKLAPHERDVIVEHVRPTSDLAAAVEGASLVIEAVPEDMGLKVDL